MLFVVVFVVSHLKEQWRKKRVTFGKSNNIVNLQKQSPPSLGVCLWALATFGGRARTLEWVAISFSNA